MSKEKEALICWRVEDLTKVRSDSVKWHCEKCKSEIWVRQINLALTMQKICMQCAAKMAVEEKEKGEEVFLHPASAAHKTGNN